MISIPPNATHLYAEIEAAVNGNCGCQRCDDGRLIECFAHQMLRDQKVIDRLLSVKVDQSRFMHAEFTR